MIVKAGLTKVREWISGDDSTGLTHMAAGTGTTAETYEDTALGTEVKRVTTIRRAANGDRIALLEARLSALDGVGSTLSEWGLLDAASGGNLFLRKMSALGDAKTNLEETRVVIQTEVK
jgi:hypothetical protein